MKPEKDIPKHEGSNPFQVPSDYWEQVQENIMQKVLQEQQKSETKAKVHTHWKIAKRISLLAACSIGFIFMFYNTDKQHPNIHPDEVSISNHSLEEELLFLEAADIIDFLAENTDISLNN